MSGFSRSSLIALAAAFSAYHIVRGILTLGIPVDPVPVVIALMIYAAVTAMTLLPFGGKGMPLWASTLAVSCAVVITLIVTSQLDATAENGYATWHTNAVGTLMTILMVRRKRVEAAAGTLFLVVYSIVWCGVLGSAQIGVTGAIAWVVLADVMTRTLQRAAADAEQLVLAEREAVRWEAAQHAHRSERRARLETASRIAGPLLRDVVLADGSLTTAEREEARLLEARLRDEIRGRALLDPRVRQAVLAARRRGAVVQLLDEGTIDELDDDQRERVLSVVAEALDSAESDRIIVRTAPETTTVAVTVVGLSAPPPGSDDPEDDVDLWLEIPRDA
ncbi:hypothetical protein SAMN04489806_0243 [Paramicrobacterium humi]|uniref:Signal transduction histidine kinase n=1 Tax=Paramicrobacterium humi TaxID=640635 RepID=A0A1H4ITS9_9MICO|nr:hypothetical protein [Microbacterium humi]SEB37235.1 hypothetical protein SAMN04489806_0243 [Microbacterium humi]